MKTLKLTLTRHGALCAILLALLFTGCKKDKKTNNDPIGPDVNFFALTNDNKLLLINGRSGVTGAQITITGLQSGEELLGIDFRPASGQLYALGSTSRLYVINLPSGAARAIGTAPFSPAISGTSVGFDFNPTVDRIRVVTSSGQNLRLNPETGTVAATDGSIVAGNKITSVAYSDNRAGAATTVLFDIDATNNKLYKQIPPNDGTLVEVGNLDVDAEEVGGFDIAPDGSALAALTVGGQSGLYSVNLATGKAVKTGNFTSAIKGIAILTDAVTYVIDNDNALVIFNPNTGSKIIKPITGLQSSEVVYGIDARPANGQLYILGSSSRIYTVNASSGVATAVGTAPFSTLLSGTEFGFDFNPVVDRIRIVSNTGQNLRIHPETGEIAGVDATLSPGTPAITAAAYNNNFTGTATTTLFDIDTETDRLYKQDPANSGVLVSVGPLNINATAANGFDIGGTSGFAYAMLTTDSGTQLYGINLTTGQATAIGVPFPTTVRGFTIGLGF